MKKFLSAFTFLVLLAAGCQNAASAGEDDGIIFDSKVAAGIYRKNAAGGSNTSAMVDISGVLTIGEKDNESGHYSVEMGLKTALQNGSAQVVSADVALKGRFLPDGNKVGIQASIPFKYRKNDNYYEFSAVEVSAVFRMVEGGGNQLLGTVGINPFTKRTYGNNIPTSSTNQLTVNTGPNTFNNPGTATIPGQDDYYYDNSSNIQQPVNFGGGTMNRNVSTSFDTSEYSLRIPVSIEYNYKSPDKKLVIQAVAYYTLRLGADALVETDSYSDQYKGQVSYTNVAWACDSNNNCNDSAYQVSGQGQITNKYANNNTLASQWFVGQNVGAKLDVQYSIYKSPVMEMLLDFQAQADVDTHVMDAIGVSHVSSTEVVEGGAIVRF